MERPGKRNKGKLHDCHSRLRSVFVIKRNVFLQSHEVFLVPMVMYRYGRSVIVHDETMEMMIMFLGKRQELLVFRNMNIRHV